MLRDVPIKTLDEYEALTGWRKYVYWKSRERKKIKQKFNRRNRRYIRMEIKGRIPEMVSEAKEEIGNA